MHTHDHTHTYLYTNTHIHMDAHNYEQHNKIHTYIHTQIYTWMHTTMNSTIKYTHTNIHTYIHTYTHTHRYFEIIEIVRKLVMASVLIFVYEGTSSQIATGFIVTLVALLLSLWLRPFNDDSLQNMHEWSLFVQSLTLLAGVMIKTDQFTEILGEKGGQGQAALGGILIFFHFLVAVTPLLDMIVQKLYIWYVNSQREGSILACCRTANIEEGDSELDTGATPPYHNNCQKQPDHRQQQQLPLPHFPTYAHAAQSTSERRDVDVSSTNNRGVSFGAGASAAVPSTSNKRDGEFFPDAGAAGVGELMLAVILVVCLCLQSTGIYICTYMRMGMLV
jgi:hypothetical protein